jgi:ATP-binding cassette subfamily C protein/ATP-binding cassette subfamily C protein LapB
MSPLLDALGWRGEETRLQESMPHFARHELDMEGFRNVMANLRFESLVQRMPLRRLDTRLLPCLFAPSNGKPLVIIQGGNGKFLAFDGEAKTYREISARGMKGKAVLFSAMDGDKPSLIKRQRGWLARAAARFRAPIRQHVLASLLVNLLAFATPLFVMTIYDQLPFLDNPLKLIYLVAGVAVFIASDFGLKTARLWLASLVSARLGYIVSTEVLRRILYLPPSYTEAASISAQHARIKDFETVREFVGSPSATALVDLPFVALLLLGLYIMAGSVVLVPLAAMALFIVAAWGMSTAIRQASEDASEALSSRQETLLEALTKLRAIKATGARGVWLERFRKAQASTALAGYRNSQLNAFMDTLTNFLVMAAGAATMAVAVGGVLQGSLTMGALVGSMFLVWRILAPMRSGFTVMMQLGRIRKSVAQLDKLMTFELEDRAEANLSLARGVRGEIAFSRVSLRYRADAQPALIGVDLQTAPGRCLLVSGHDGAGKSTILKLILGMYQPQAGRITLDGVNLRQYDPATLRRLISYAPEAPQFFYGSIAQNLALANPGASREEMLEACERVGVLEEVENLPQGIETRIGDFKAGQLSTSFHRRLDLARALVRPAPLVLVDQVLDKLSPEGVRIPMHALEELKHSSSLVLVSNNPCLFDLADATLWLERGRVRMFGPADEVIPLLSRQSFCECPY